MLDWKKYTQSNRKAWNEAAKKHKKARLEKGCYEFDATKQYLDHVVVNFIQENKLVKDKAITQLCCNSGRETIALKKMGAKRCVGFDFADEAILEAKYLAQQTGQQCEFIQADVLEIGKEFFNCFDMIFVSAGALIWLPDLKRFFEISAKLLKKGGGVLLHEIHPLVWILEDAPLSNPLQITNSYFKEGPILEYGGLDYIGNEDYQGEANYSFDHTLADIFNAMIDSNFKIKKFNEYQEDISACFSHLEQSDIKLPMSFLLYAQL